MLFRNRPPDVDFNVFIEHERINRVHVTKFLGIYIDDKLKWKYHINTVIDHNCRQLLRSFIEQVA